MITSTDPIADMLTRIRNALAVSKNEISLPHSKFKESLAKVLLDNGYIYSFDVVDNPKKSLVIIIKPEGSIPKIKSLKKISKPGRRIYVNASKIPQVKQGKGIIIISTSRGVITGNEAKKLNIGGELICEVV